MVSRDFSFLGFTSYSLPYVPFSQSSSISSHVQQAGQTAPCARFRAAKAQSRQVKRFGMAFLELPGKPGFHKSVGLPWPHDGNRTSPGSAPKHTRRENGWNHVFIQHRKQPLSALWNHLPQSTTRITQVWNIKSILHADKATLSMNKGLTFPNALQNPFSIIPNAVPLAQQMDLPGSTSKSNNVGKTSLQAHCWGQAGLGTDTAELHRNYHWWQVCCSSELNANNAQKSFQPEQVLAAQQAVLGFLSDGIE